MRRTHRSIPLATLILLACACAEGIAGDDHLNADAAPIAAEAEALLAGAQTVGRVLTLTPTAPAKDFELRKWWEDTAPLIRRIPRRAVVVLGAAKPKRATASAPYWYQVAHAGTWGWIRASELELFHEPYPELSARRRNALDLARSAMGFSYWWGNARWLRSGPTTWPPTGDTEYGADCSGFISTVWGFPDQDPEVDEEGDGFQTRAFAVDRRNAWATVELDDALPGDAMVQYDAAQKRGHIVLVAEARDDRWIKSYECEGCSAGCRARRREIPNPESSDMDIDWHAIRRHGWPDN
jgi:hypothetical protein